MRMMLTGQVGLDKAQYLQQVQDMAREAGEPVRVFNVGEMMYREAPDVRPGRILDLPLSRLTSLRRAVFRDILNEAPRHRHVIVNSHATFRWRNGLFSAFDFDQLAMLNADVYVTLLDNVESVHGRLLRDGTDSHTLKDLLVWREEEILATEIISKVSPDRPTPFFVLARGREKSTARTLFRLLTRPGMRKVYPSFPMSHVVDMPQVLDEIQRFRQKLAGYFIAFDPGDVDEKQLYDRAVAALGEHQQTLNIQLDGRTATLRSAEIVSVGADINGQIYARDFMMVRQSDMIVSLIPELPGGRPGLSSGVERELQHAFDHGREVYVIWKPQSGPSPFITQTATHVFTSVDEAINHFKMKGMIMPQSLFEAAGTP